MNSQCSTCPALPARPSLIVPESVVRETWLSRPLDQRGILAASLGILALAIVSSRAWMGDERLSATASQVFDHHEYWRAWTSVLVHADVGHFLSNSLLFFVLGSVLAGYFGWFVFPVAAFAMGGFINLFSLMTYPPDVQLVGASGLVFWMGGAWLVLYACLDRSRRLGQRLLRSIGVGLVLFMPGQAFDPSISYRTHAIGFGLGIVWAFIYFLVHRRQFRAAEVHEFLVDDGEELGLRSVGGAGDLGAARQEDLN